MFLYRYFVRYIISWYHSRICEGGSDNRGISYQLVMVDVRSSVMIKRIQAYKTGASNECIMSECWFNILDVISISCQDVSCLNCIALI